MVLTTEFMRSASAVVLAVAKALAPIPELTTPLNIDMNTPVMQTAKRSQDTYNSRLSALYFEDQWKTARGNTNLESARSSTFQGQTPACDRPRRKVYHTDKFVLSWDPPKV